jgi:hypothetical protein
VGGSAASTDAAAPADRPPTPNPSPPLRGGRGEGQSLLLRQTAWALAGFIVLIAVPAWADGTLGLGEVLAAVDRAPKLVAEIQAEVSKSNLKVADLTCMGARHGNQWTYLGGGRAAPYNCDIGQRSLHIEADRIYFDARGKSLGDVVKADQKRAKTFQESNFRWTWTP